MTARCPDRAKKAIRAWAIVPPDHKPFDGDLSWWAFDVYRSKREALRVKTPDEKLVRVEVRRG